MLKISSANSHVHQLDFVVSHALLANEQKHFQCDIHDTDSTQAVYRLIKDKTSQQSTVDEHDFITACDFWRQEGGEIEAFSETDTESVLRLSIFSNPQRILRRQNTQILRSSNLDQFKDMLIEIEAHRKRAVLLVDDGLLSIKFLLHQTLAILGLGKIPEDAPTSKLQTAENWQKMKFFMLNYPQWYIVCACNGAVAQELLIEFTPDIFITDENMPEKQGSDLIRWFREHRQDQEHVRIALHSSDTDKPWKEILAPLNAVFFRKADRQIFNTIFDFSQQLALSK